MVDATIQSLQPRQRDGSASTLPNIQPNDVETDIKGTDATDYKSVQLVCLSEIRISPLFMIYFCIVRNVTYKLETKTCKLLFSFTFM